MFNRINKMLPQTNVYILFCNYTNALDGFHGERIAKGSAKETNAIGFFFSYWNTDTEDVKISDAKNVISFSNIFFIFRIKDRKKGILIVIILDTILF